MICLTLPLWIVSMRYLSVSAKLDVSYSYCLPWLHHSFMWMLICLILPCFILWKARLWDTSQFFSFISWWFLCCWRFAFSRLMEVILDTLIAVDLSHQSIWTYWGLFLCRPPPRIPELHLSEDMVINFASALRVEINKALAIAHDIALGKDLKVFLKVLLNFACVAVNM